MILQFRCKKREEPGPRTGTGSSVKCTLFRLCYISLQERTTVGIASWSALMIASWL